jgi:uncharacterized protein
LERLQAASAFSLAMVNRVVEVKSKNLKTEIKQVSLPLSATALDEAKGTGAGYLSVFNYRDKQGDIVVPGAFARTIKELEAARRERNGHYLLPVLWQHLNEPVGGFTLLREDEKGLYCEFEVDMTTELGRRAYSALKKQYVGGFSIGYRTIKDQMRNDGVRLLLEVELLEPGHGAHAKGDGR